MTASTVPPGRFASRLTVDTRFRPNLHDRQAMR
jgi:hypothetical protein